MGLHCRNEDRELSLIRGEGSQQRVLLIMLRPSCSIQAFLSTPCPRPKLRNALCGVLRSKVLDPKF